MTITAGTHILDSVLDPNLSISEFDETNNTSTRPYVAQDLK